MPLVSGWGGRGGRRGRRLEKDIKQPQTTRKRRERSGLNRSTRKEREAGLRNPNGAPSFLTGASVPSAALPLPPSQFAGTPLKTIVSGRFPGSSRPKAASRAPPLSLSLPLPLQSTESTLDPTKESAQSSPSLSADDSDTSCGGEGEGEKGGGGGCTRDLTAGGGGTHRLRRARFVHDMPGDKHKHHTRIG